jgi:hypothetical protein
LSGKYSSFSHSSSILQIFDSDYFGVYFGSGDLCFWCDNIYALGEQTNGFTDVDGNSFVQPAEGPHALNNGEKGNFVLVAFQVLLVKPVEGSFVRRIGCSF